MTTISRLGGFSISITILLAGTVLVSGARAQEPPSSSFDLPLVLDTGSVENVSTHADIVGSFLVNVPGAEWMRLRFSEVTLAGDHEKGTGSKLRLVSVNDGATQDLDSRQCRQWSNTSCYFNGDAVEVEILAEPGTGANRAVLSEVIVGISMQAQTQCGAVDNRVPSNDVRQARVLPIGCTTWLINDCGHCFLTAGHCASGIGVIEFNVPPSTDTGALQHPPAEDQYVADPVSVQASNGGQGNDWCYYGCFPNPVTGLTPFERQQASYVLASASPPFTPGVSIRVTGYGVDTTIPGYNQIQQTAEGPYGPSIGTIIQYAVDTLGGDSGSPVILEHNGTAIGIHTNGGCLPAGHGYNSGTAIENSHLQEALARPVGVCAAACAASVSTYCTAKKNSQHCLPSISTTGSPSVSAGAGSFWIRAGSVINHKPGFLLYAILPDDRPFMGGTLCLASPMTRTSGQTSGGNAGADDCSGTYAFDMGARISSGVDARLHAGTTAYAQYWSRDPASHPYTIGLSNAVRFTIGP